MTTKKTPALTARERANADVATWHAAKLAEASERARHDELERITDRNFWPRTPSCAAQLAIVDSKIRLIDLAAATASTMAQAAASLSKAERDDGDELALAVCAWSFRTGLADRIAAHDADPGARTTKDLTEYVASTRKAEVALEARRRAAGLPVNPRLPRPTHMGTDAPFDVLLFVLDCRLDAEFALRNSDKVRAMKARYSAADLDADVEGLARQARLQPLRHEQCKLRVAIGEAAKAAEERAARELDWERSHP